MVILFFIYAIAIGFFTAEKIATTWQWYVIHMLTAWFTVPLQFIFEWLADVLICVREK